MTDPSTVLADSNVIIDIVRQDPRWAGWSLDELSRHEDACVNPIIYAELCYQDTSVEEVDQLLGDLSLRFVQLPRASLYLASQAFREYRRRGGTRNAPLPDFFIGAHAAVLGIPILTRDVKRYRAYFASVELISP